MPDISLEEDRLGPTGARTRRILVEELCVGGMKNLVQSEQFLTCFFTYHTLYES